MENYINVFWLAISIIISYTKYLSFNKDEALEQRYKHLSALILSNFGY